MRSTWIAFFLFLLVCVVSFYSGRAYQYAKTGYRYTLLNETNYEDKFGKLTIRHHEEAVGLYASMQRYTSIVLSKPDIRPDIVLYRCLNEPLSIEPNAHHPVREVILSEEGMEWNDGILVYNLAIESAPMPRSF